MANAPDADTNRLKTVLRKSNTRLSMIVNATVPLLLSKEIRSVFAIVILYSECEIAGRALQINDSRRKTCSTPRTLRHYDLN